MARFLSFSFVSILAIAGFLLFLFPALHSGWALFTDPGLRTGGPTKIAFRMHHSLSERIPSYVEQRIESCLAETLSVSEITATEWPVYGAFFYLLATEQLQEQWEVDPALASKAPKISGKNAINASLRILLDDGHAHWVKLYWGEDYLEDENCFYRMLLIGGLSAHHNLTGSTEHLPFLKTLTDDMAADLQNSPSGLIDDYPGQCFPADVIGGLAMVRKASRILGEDRDQWSKEILSRILTVSNNQLPPYTASSKAGIPITSSRGCTNGFCLPYLREINPLLAADLYENWVDRFWEQGTITRGWREFPKGSGNDSYYYDPDSGPVINHMGSAATGLGLGAARAYGDGARSGALGMEFLTTSFPTISGRLMLPALVGDKVHAPLFPEIVLLAQLAHSSESPGEKGPIPPIFWISTTLQLVLGALFCFPAWRTWRRFHCQYALPQCT